MSWGMADRCSGAWLTTMGLAAVVASGMHGGGPARPATIRPRPERNAASTRATRPSPPTRRPARSSPARLSTPPANTDTASRRTMSRCPTTDVKHASGDPSTMPKTSHPKYVTCRQKWRLFSWPGISRRKGGSM